jgi:hypothetical protein
MRVVIKDLLNLSSTSYDICKEGTSSILMFYAIIGQKVAAITLLPEKVPYIIEI